MEALMLATENKFEIKFQHNKFSTNFIDTDTRVDNTVVTNYYLAPKI